MPRTRTPRIAAVDVFCGVGGLSYGLAKAGINVRAGFDLDPRCETAYRANLHAAFHQRDVSKLTGEEVRRAYPQAAIRLLAGCAPCQPFSTHRRGADTTSDSKWSLLDEFGRLVSEVLPELVTMENVLGLRSTLVFKRFVETLTSLGFHVTWKSCHGQKYGLGQRRRRLVLLASRLGEITGPMETHQTKPLTVKDVIGKLPAVEAGGCDPHDRLHKARSLTPINRLRMLASRPGGTWRDWPEHLRAPCHLKASGASFQSVYARMKWSEPSPTITTQAFNFGTGRFGHPKQCRSLTLREAAMLQGFPKSYIFLGKDDNVEFTSLGRLIGNAVPPPLGEAIGRTFVHHVAEFHRQSPAVDP